MTKNTLLRAALSALLLIAPLGAGCGGAAGAYQEDTFVEPEREDPAELLDEQQVAEAELALLMSQTSPDCEAACPLVTRICGLSPRICAIAERHPRDEPLQAQCEDARARCERAEERASASCGCPRPTTEP